MITSVHHDGVRCCANDNLLTNFNKEERHMYEAAIRRYGKDDIFVTEEAYLNNGMRDPSLCALRCTGHKDRSEFWRIFREIKSARG